MHKNNVFWDTLFSRTRAVGKTVLEWYNVGETWKFVCAVALPFTILSVYFIFFFAPVSFPVGSYVTIKKGETVRQVATTLAEKHIVESANAFTIFVRTVSKNAGVKAGTYRFNKSEGLLFVTYRLVTGDFGVAPIRVTLLEGMTARDMGKVLAKKFPNITAEGFRTVAFGKEGYLFPDTYTFLPDVYANTVVATMLRNFNTRIASVTPKIQASGHSLKDVIIMASLIEREGRTLKEKRMISGILWNRIRVGMPLQVDAVFGYIFGRKTYSPSRADLKVNSLYNTYTHVGLPPGPISNPGIESILAATTPTKTHYLYYITGNDGKMHYASTLAVHNHNIARYLK